MTVKITVEEWLAALSHSYGPHDDAMTVEEWSTRLGLCRNSKKVSEWIRTGLQQGWMEHAFKRKETITCRYTTIPAFRLAIKPQKVKRG